MRRKKLQTYAALTGAFLGSTTALQAGVVYTDLDPDQVANNSFVPIDFNGDGTPEFAINHVGNSYTTTTSSGAVYGFGYNLIGLYGNGLGNYGFVASTSIGLFVDALSAGALIGPAAPLVFDTFGSLGYQFSDISPGSGFTASSGQWSGVSDRYLGVVFRAGADSYFGWIRADVSAGYGQARILDYAFESTPNTPIAAGDTVGTAPCSSALAPDNQSHVLESVRAVLNWDPPSGASACHVEGQRLPTGPMASLGIVSPPINTAKVPFAAAGAGTTWTWRVRCACSISPLDVSPFSPFGDTFTVPTPKEAHMADLEAMPKALSLAPNPTQGPSMLKLQDPMDRQAEVRILDMSGRVVDFIRLPANATSLELDFSALAKGMYFLQLADLEPLPFELQHGR